jgi:hypothetical protein
MDNLIKLPFVIPEYQTYPLNTGINGILEAYNDADIWTYNNYITLWTYKSIYNKKYQMDFRFDLTKDCREICSKICIEYFETFKEDNIIDVIKEQISKKKYLFVSVDTFYLDVWWYDKNSIEHTEHQELVIGYNDAEEKVLVADFFKGKYSVQEIDYLAFRMAYDAHAGYLRDVTNKNSVEVMLYQYDGSKDEKLELGKIKGMINDFLNSEENTVDDVSESFVKIEVVHGMECLRKIIDCFDEKIKAKEWFDYRAIHLIYLFNYIMSRRIQYMIDNKYLEETEDIKQNKADFSNIADQVKKLRMKVIKYNMRRNGGEMIIDTLKSVYSKQKKSLRKLQTILKEID